MIFLIKSSRTVKFVAVEFGKNLDLLLSNLSVVMGIRIPVEKIRILNITDKGLINYKSLIFLSSIPVFDMYKISWKRHCTYVLGMPTFWYGCFYFYILVFFYSVICTYCSRHSCYINKQKTTFLRFQIDKIYIFL